VDFLALTTGLGLLSSAHERPAGDLETQLQSFVVDLRAAVSSYVGLNMTIALDGHEISITRSDGTRAAATSLRIPTPSSLGGTPGSALVLYAATPGAFIDLAAGLAWALGLDLSDLVLDEHLPAPVLAQSVIGLHGHAVINRAIGALIAHGHTPESARTELRSDVGLDRQDVPAAAQRILNDLRSGTPPRAA
jgi:hypothetical protein